LAWKNQGFPQRNSGYFSQKWRFEFPFRFDLSAQPIVACDVRVPSAPNQLETVMERGIDFLKSQVNNAVMQHKTFLESLEDHEKQAEDSRFRDLCSRHIPRVREHQRMLEQYQTSIGAEAGEGKKILGTMLGKAKDLADAARESDFLRLVSDIVMSRQAEDTFKTFRDAGRALGNTELAQIGDIGERHHDEFNREANRLVQMMFIEHVQGVSPGLTTDQPTAR
jgi:hypothetical protein